MSASLIWSSFNLLSTTFSTPPIVIVRICSRTQMSLVSSISLGYAMPLTSLHCCQRIESTLSLITGHSTHTEQNFHCHWLQVSCSLSNNTSSIPKLSWLRSISSPHHITNGWYISRWCVLISSIMMTWWTCLH